MTENTTPSRNHETQESAGVLNVLTILAQELQKLNSRNTAHASSPPNSGAHATFSPVSVSSARRSAADSHDAFEPSHSQSRKRRRVDSCGNPSIELAAPLSEISDASYMLPPPEFLEEIISVYFFLVQPWIPVLHETQFRRRINDAIELPKLVVVLHAILVAAIRFVEGVERRLSVEDIDRQVQKSRNIVVLSAMEDLSVENLQALIIVAFTDVCVPLSI